jgi:hypothetical protein
VTRHRSLKTIAAAASATLLALSVFSATGVSAAQPGWDIDITNLPEAVSPGADAGYRLVIENNGPSNIAQLFLNDDLIDVAPTFLAGQRVNLCQTSPELFCSFGALNAGDSITLTVAYTTFGSGSFPVTFQLNTTGASFNDKGKNSHGDTFTKTATTLLDGDQNFAGGFIDGSFSVANSETLSRRNIQSTSATGTGTGIPVTVQDGSGTSAACAATLLTPLGECSEVNVAEGQVVDGLIQVVITIFDKKVPNNIDLGGLVVNHTFTIGGVTQTVEIPAPASNTPCPDPPVVNCLTATLLENGDLEIIVYVAHNGGFKPGLK